MFHPHSFSFFIFLIYCPPLSVSSPFFSLLSPPLLLLNTDQPSCLYLPHPSSFAPPSPSADSVPYLCPHPSISALFCFEGVGGQPVIRISFLCSLTHSFHYSLRTLTLWCFYLPLLKDVPSQMKVLFEERVFNERNRAEMENGERERSGEETCRGGPWGVVVHTVDSHHYKLESGAQPLLRIISLHTVLCNSVVRWQCRDELKCSANKPSLKIQHILED